MPKAKKAAAVKKTQLAPLETKTKLALSSVRNIKLTLEYDGTDFFGFQRQPNGVPTIQQAIETALENLFQKKIPLASASSRTDAGVHAEDQVLHFKVTSDLSCHRIERGLNHFLPSTISVLKAEDVAASFHARFQPTSKIYEYLIWNGASRPALLRNRAYYVPSHLNLSLMRQASKYLIGKHDFSAFTSVERAIKGRHVERKKISFVRTLMKCEIKKKGAIVVLKVQADGFLYHMVRNIAGTLVAAGKGKLAVEEVPRILKSCDRKRAAATLPACGLTLKKVIYPRLVGSRRLRNKRA